MLGYINFIRYCMDIVALIVYFIFLYRVVDALLFEIQTYTNANAQIEVSPKGTRIFSKWFAGITGVGLIILMAWLFIPLVLCTPMVIAGKPIGIPKEVLSNHKDEIAFIWLAIGLALVGLTGKRLLESLTKRVKKKRKYTEVYLWGKEYSLLLLLQAFVTCMCFLILLGAIVGNYNDTIGTAWKILVWVDYIMLIINGVFIHQKLYIFDNGLVTYQKYRKAGFGQKEELEIIVDESNKMKIKMKGKELFILVINAKDYVKSIQKEELKNFEERKWN
ncbi:MAG: hypothetical protein U0K68_13630 [Agathobacter sp.]|nr:hypothetical protein [Agathobacter sp.]